MMILSNKRAVSYLRVSSAGQVDGDGFPRQGSCTSAFADRQELNHLAMFYEDISGTENVDNRPVFQELLTFAKQHSVEIVLVENSDRVARDLMISESAYLTMRKLNLCCIACDSGTDLTVCDDDPSRVMVRQILGSVAQNDRTRLVLKLRAARNRKRLEKGRCEGVKPFGFSKADPPESQDAFNMMKSLYARGFRMREIAERLNDANMQTRKGGKWTCFTVRAVLETAGIHQPKKRNRNQDEQDE